MEIRNVELSDEGCSQIKPREIIEHFHISPQTAGRMLIFGGIFASAS